MSEFKGKVWVSAQDLWRRIDVLKEGDVEFGPRFGAQRLALWRKQEELCDLHRKLYTKQWHHSGLRGGEEWFINRRHARENLRKLAEAAGMSADKCILMPHQQLIEIRDMTPLSEKDIEMVAQWVESTSKTCDALRAQLEARELDARKDTEKVPEASETVEERPVPTATKHFAATLLVAIAAVCAYYFG